MEETVLLRGLMGMARETGRTPGAIVARLGHLKTAAKQGERGELDDGREEGLVRGHPGAS